MFVNEERDLVRKGYMPQEDETAIFNYTKEGKNVIVSYYPFRDKYNYKFSFPISHKKQYATYFTEKDDLQKYIRFIIDSHL